ncbi:MAG TPA: phosphotransferase [Gaiellaceae bacterium]|nr:phosphotransferase [Gaiellaceae bacterium]
MGAAAALEASPTDASSPTAASPLERVRRVDWRFLLPDPLPRRVACLVPHDPAVAEAFELLGAEVTTGSAAAARRGSYDVVVTRRARPADLRQAAELVRPGGAIQLELPGRQARRCTRRLRALGFVDARAYWHWPGWRDCRELVPLDSPNVIRFALGRRRQHGLAAVKGRLGRALLRARVFRLAVSQASVLAGRPEVAAASVQAEPPSSDPPYATWLASGPPLLVTPRFRASRHVLSLILPPGASQPVAAVKAARLPGDGSAIVAETVNLWALESTSTTATGTVPRVLACDPGEQPYLVETALAGRPLTPADVRRDPAATVGAVCTWLEGLSPDALFRPVLDQATFGQLVERPLIKLAQAYGSLSEEALLARATIDLLAPFEGAGLPLVFEHGDLSPPNVLRLEDGRIGVLDWELAHPHGLPAHDLLFFIGYAAFALRDARTTEAQVAAVHEAFLGPSPWAVPALSGYARRLGIDRMLLAPLFVACWARYTTGLLERAAATDAQTLAWLRANRYFALWRHAVEHVHEFPGSRP